MPSLLEAPAARGPEQAWKAGQSLSHSHSLHSLPDARPADAYLSHPLSPASSSASSSSGAATSSASSSSLGPTRSLQQPV